MTHEIHWEDLFLIIIVFLPQGPYFNESLGPNSPIVGELARAARCIKPESLPINKSIFSIIKKISAKFVFPTKLNKFKLYHQKASKYCFIVF